MDDGGATEATRFVTALLYLTDAGSTSFPVADLVVPAQRGRLVLFDLLHRGVRDRGDINPWTGPVRRRPRRRRLSGFVDAAPRHAVPS